MPIALSLLAREPPIRAAPMSRLIVEVLYMCFFFVPPMVYKCMINRKKIDVAWSLLSKGAKC